jgi:hypothetical protein
MGPESSIQNSISEIQDRKSEIQNPKSKLHNHAVHSCSRSILRSLAGRARLGWLLFCALVGAGTGGYFGLYLPAHNREAERERQIAVLKQVVERLTSERRVAEVSLLQRTVDPQSGHPVLTVSFVEYDRAGRPLPMRYLRTIGDEVYFDALVVKFENEYVAAGDALRGHSIHLFRRAFGNLQRPEDGDLIDNRYFAGTGIPDVYRVDPNPSDYEVHLWQNFWNYAGDPEAARQQGVRVLQGEAVYARLLPGRLYTLSIQANGGLNLTPGPVPPTTRS